MQDEINEKVVALSVKGAKLTAETLQKAIKAMLAQAKKQQEKQPHGKHNLLNISPIISGWCKCYHLFTNLLKSFDKILKIGRAHV